MEQFIDIVQKETGKLILYDRNIQKQRINFKRDRPIPRKALFSVFKSILETMNHGLTEIELEGMAVCKITQSQRTFTGPKQTFSGEAIKENPAILPKDDTMVTVVYPLKYAEARTASNQLRQIINSQQGGKILGIPNVNVVVVTSFGSVMQRVFKIIDLMDVPGPQPVWKVVKLDHADPEVIATKVESILQTSHTLARNRQLQAQPPGKLVPEPRTRSVIIQALPEQYPEILSLIKKLDIKLDKEPSLVHVVRLKHTNAEDMEETINQIIQANPDLGLEPGGESPAPTPRPPRMPGSPVRPRPAPRRPRSGPRLPRGPVGYGMEEERAAAIANKDTNSLIIVAPEAYFLELKKIIDQLDVRRPQVLIEVMILEVSSARSLNLGAELAVLDRAADKKTRGFGATAFGLSNIVDQDGNTFDFTSMEEGEGPPTPMGRLPTFADQGITMGLMVGKNFRIPILLTLFGSDQDVKIVSLPRILTNANEEAELRVLDEVPTSQSQSTAAVSNITGFSGYENAGITLVITPHISENDSLRLEIDQTIEQFGKASPAVGGVVLPPSKTNREIKNEVTVPNHKTVILGGLTSTITTDVTAKIPLLGDIPLLGVLFRKSEKKTEKTNLFVFITPHILNDPGFRDLERLSDEALREMRDLGMDTALIDRHYRQVRQDNAGMGSGKPGKTVDVMEYLPARK
ncbi:MAG: secretin N-terminal domain-containing protein [Planctomycetota bacterium]|jgi:general secretion pathway protein D